MKRVLVLSPHPDDESIGCGGAICQHVLDGDVVHLEILTSGEKGGHGRDEITTRRLRERESMRASSLLGVHHIEFWRAPDGALRATPQLVARLTARLRALRPDVIYTPHEKEAHPDHRATARLLRRALALAQTRSWRPLVRCYEVWTPIETMSEIVDITRHVRTKRSAIRAYKSQCAVLDFEAAALGLNRYRGEMHCWPEGEFAEVFSALKA